MTIFPNNLEPPAAGRAETKSVAGVHLSAEKILASLMGASLPDVLLIHDHAGRILDVNVRACSTLGHARKALLAMCLADVVEDFDLASAQAAWSRVEPGVSMIERRRLRRKHDDTYPVEAHLGLMEPDGERLYVVIFRDIGERERIREQLTDSEHSLAEAQRMSHAGSWTWNVVTGEVRWSRELYAIYGLDPERFVPSIDSFRPFIHPDDRTLVEEKIAAIVATGAPVEFEFRIVAADGTTRVLLSKGEVTKVGADGTPCVVMGVNLDITARKNTEKLIRDCETEYRAVVESSVDGFWIVDERGRLVAVNDVYARRSGYDRETLLNMRITDLDAQETPGEVEKHVQYVRQQGADLFETTHRTRSGELWPVEVNTVFHAEAGGRFFVFLRDITKRRQAERALRDSEERLRLFIEHAPVALAMFDREMRYLAASRRWREDYALDDRALVGCSHYDIFPEIGARWKAVYSRALAGKTVRVDEDRFVRNDGKPRWLRWEVLPWRTAGGEIGGVLIFTEDITERKRLEEEALRHRDLMHSLASKEVALQTAAAFAHELNQPLVSIIAYNEVVLRSLPESMQADEKLVHAIQGSHRQALRAGKVLHELMENLHRREIEPGPFDLNELVRDVVEAIRTGWFHEFQVVLDLESGLAPVLGNRIQTEKVLHNLIRNGLEAMAGAGVGPALFVISVRTLAGHDMAHVTIRDSGPGLAAEVARRLFEPFFSTKENGLGLGLLISRSLIEAQGGQLWLDPEDGPGAVFHFTLPFATDDGRP